MSFVPKLIAIDIDGTMLNSENKLTSRTKDTIRKAVKQNFNVVVATGRMYTSALPIIKEAGIYLPSIFFDGALIRNPKTHETLHERGLGEELTAEILSFYRSNGWYIQAYFDDNLFVVDNNDPRCKQYESIAKVSAVSLGDDFWNFHVDSSKLLGIENDSIYFQNILNRTREAFGNRIYSAPSWGAFIEITHPNVNKANALSMVARKLGISQEEVLAIGDSYNDIEMLEWAGHGVAMGNAYNSIKAVADEIAADNNQDGAAQIIERYLTE